ncbi:MULTISPECIES: hypothetical protein [Stutzerimonas stutzeri subgroup]|jgi:hypothetical protein|uniref:hypothetical protein n=1 Tax=Stutzerimonas stutzeri subgroup TaxID=578833 RepID=UPI0005F17C04|nr:MULTISPECIES: hypothetical protein [Stutzerimonas stutzeri subgroup]KRW70168.1 hypothetical protein AO741_17605 [Pseudomonas sp. TTU2014-105ASC]MDH2246604.1 hypothetical protein [Pseudomonas sp. GD03856]MDH2265237.1 hypothetical protein [Pseudomonas sp. GD03855]OWG40135.1 hypothetical protein CAQ69_02225 [Stutzerimonas stutzeri]PAO91445.1 hypothetical protein BV581_14800 [Stutzerimonas stutzeri]
MSLDHLLRPFQLRRLVMDLEQDRIVIDAANDVGTIQIDLRELQANRGSAILENFDAGDRELIDRFSKAAWRDFE